MWLLYCQHIGPIDPSNTNYQPLNKNYGSQTCDSCHENTPVLTKKRSIVDLIQRKRPFFKSSAQFSSTSEVLGEIRRKPSNLDLSPSKGGVSNEKSQQVHQLQRGLRGKTERMLNVPCSTCHQAEDLNVWKLKLWIEAGRPILIIIFIYAVCWLPDI